MSQFYYQYLDDPTRKISVVQCSKYVTDGNNIVTIEDPFIIADITNPHVWWHRRQSKEGEVLNLRRIEVADGKDDSA